MPLGIKIDGKTVQTFPPKKKKHRDPGADDRMKKFESSLRQTMKKPAKKKPSACGQGSCSSANIRGYK